MKIVGIEGLSAREVRDEVNRGGKFVIYGWCISLLVVTLRRSSDVTFVRAGSSPVVAGLGWSALTFFLGWWGFPWGLIYTPMVLIENFSGGKDVTREVMLSLDAELRSAFPSAGVSSERASQPAYGAPTENTPGTASDDGATRDQPEPTDDASTKGWSSGALTPNAQNGTSLPAQEASSSGALTPNAQNGTSLPAHGTSSSGALTPNAPNRTSLPAHGTSTPRPAPFTGAPPVAASSTATRDIVGLVLAVVSFCCAPVGWIAAVLAVLSIRDARAQGQRAPVLSVLSLVVAGLSTLLFVGTVGYAVLEDSKWGRRANEAEKEAATGRMRPELDARTACGLAKAALWRGAFQRVRDWDSLECQPPLTNDAVTPALDVTAKRLRHTEHLTVCFARSNVRWYALSARDTTTCPDLAPLSVSQGTSDDELDRLELQQQRTAEDAPDKVFKPHASGLVVEPELGDDDPFITFPLSISRVVDHHRPTATPPFHAAGGKWTYFELAPSSAPSCAIRMGVLQKGPSKDPFSFTDVMLTSIDDEQSRCFVEALRVALSTREPGAAKPKPLVPVKLGAAVLGQGMVRDEAGGFTSADEHSVGRWTTMKLFFERDDEMAEVFFNFDVSGGVAELSEKDPEYRAALVALLHRALIDGW